MQSELGSIFYSWDCAAESVLCRRGDLVGVSHDMLSSWSGSARVMDVEVNGSGQVVSVCLDAVLPVASHYFMDQSSDLSEEEDLSVLGLRSGVAVRGSGGTAIHPIHSSVGQWLNFDPPVPPAWLEEDSLVAVGPLGREYLRLVVFGVSPRENYEASVIAVDEAPGLWDI